MAELRLMIVTRHTYDLRPSRWRHPLLRLRWWRNVRREKRRRARLTPEQREAEDQLFRNMERAFLFGSHHDHVHLATHEKEKD